MREEAYENVCAWIADRNLSYNLRQESSSCVNIHHQVIPE